MPILPGFIQNASLLLILGLIYDLRTRHATALSPRTGRWTFGILLGAAGIFTMLVPVRVGPSLILDSRGLLLAISGLFFGLVPTAIAIGITAAYRALVVGGPSTLTGLVFITGSGLLGLALRRVHNGGQGRSVHWINFAALGLAVGALQTLLAWRLLQPSAPELVGSVAGTLLSVSTVAGLLMGLLLRDRFRHAEVIAQLAERESSFRTLAEQLPAIIYRAALDEQSTTLYLSPAVRQLGYEPEAMIANPDLYVDALHPDDRDRVLAALAEDRRRDRSSDLTYRFRRSDGTYRTIRDRAQIVHGPSGQPLYLQGVMVDITEQEQSAEKQALQAAALNAAVDAIAITDLDGRFLWVNPSFAALTQFSAEEALGKNPRELIKSGHHDRAFYATMWNTLLDGRVWSGELVNRRKDGSPYTEEQTITPVKDAQGRVTHFIAIKRDVTHRRLLEQQLNQSQRIDSIGRLAGGVAHDFNNLLTVINGTVELAMARAQSDAETTQDLKTIRNAANRGAKLTRQLLAFSRQQVLQPTVIDLNASVTDMHALLSRVIGERVTMRLELQAGLSHIRADAGQLGQVLMNLVVNARDAMPDGGTIGVRTDNATIEAKGPRLTPDMPPGRYVLLSVTDTGIGMDAATRERIFEPFFTTKAPGKGTGLGLPTAYGIVKQSDGFIWVDSALGKGTAFHLAFPAVEGEIHERSSGPSPRLDLADDVPITATVLLVEDEDAIRQVATRVLSSRGFTVLSAASGEDALRVAEGQHVDLLLTDMVMPGMSGPDLAQRLRADRPQMRVLFTSGYSRDAVAQQFGMEDAGFIAKPYGLQELVAAVRERLPSS